MGTAPDQFRPDVEGLRALAVLLVIAFHVNEALLPGGFVGVDMFFVISGFVITLWMTREVAAGTFTLAEFYRRRVRRIMPALFSVIIAAMFAGIILMLPGNVVSLSWSAAWAALSLGNVYFAYFLDTSYFAADSRALPLLHLWSLGVEEQFYLIWPIFMLGLLRFPRLIVPILVGLIIASVVYGQFLIDSGEVSQAYYMLPSRLYQLATGGLLAVLMGGKRPLQRARFAYETIGLVGLAGVAWSTLMLRGDTPYPGVASLPVTLGTALVIFGGSKQTILRAALSTRLMRAIGARSYSLYLWHWPVLAFPRYLKADLTPVEQFIAVAVIGVFAELSFRFLESPFRKSALTLRQLSLRVVAGPAVVIFALCAWFVTSAGFGPYPPGLKDVISASGELTMPISQAAPVCIPRIVTPKEFFDPRCVFRVPGHKDARILLWGDSNAAHYVGTVNVAAKAADVSVQNIALSACPPLLEDAAAFAHPVYKDACSKSLPFIVSQLDRFDVLILGGQWGTYFTRGDFRSAMDKTLAALSPKHSRIIIMGMVPFFSEYDPQCRPKSYKAPFLDCLGLPHLANGGRADKKMFDELAKKYANVVYFDPFPYLCPADHCSPYIDGAPIYTNSTHLGYGGSVLLGEKAASTLSKLLSIR